MISERETIGTLYVEKQQLLGEYQRLLGIVEQMSLGHIRPDQVVVDMTAQSWSLVPASEDPPEAQPLEDTPEEQPDG